MLRLTQIDKSFGATRAVHGVTLDAAPGAVLGLVGENGAGKSTLLRIVGGVMRPDSGQLELDGTPLAVATPHEAQARGIATVFQELTLLKDLTVEENLFLADPPTSRWGTIDRRRLRDAATALLAAHGLEIAPAARVGDLPLGRQQMLEILRAVHRRPRVLLLDEATAALGATEVDWLRLLVQRLKAAGTIVLFISHRWEEITGFCNRVAVLRNGELVGTAAISDLNEGEAVRLMTGRADADRTFPPRHGPRRDVALTARGLEWAGAAGVDLDLFRGEIVGIGGLVGQGQGHLLEALFGARPSRGTVTIGGRPLVRRTPARAMQAGLAYVPQERKTEGLLLSKCVATNMTLAMLPALAARLGLIDRQSERRIVADGIARQHIRTRGADEPVRALSGGNQQKVLLERWLLRRPEVLLLNDVTRGVDIATKQQIYRTIAGIAAEGTAVLWYSTDTAELVGMAHRVLVMLGGRVSAEFAAGDATPHRIVAAAVMGTSGGTP